MTRIHLFRTITIAAMVAATVGIHYGLLLEPLFGDSHWIHAIHGRFCYIPIVMGAAWYGLRGGLITALVVSALVSPFILLGDLDAHSFAGEAVEVVFYFAIAALAGALLDRENAARLKREEMRLQLERSQKFSLVGQMAAGVAHEIKNPLASIKGAVEIVCDDQTSEVDQRQFRDIIIREIRRIDRTVRDFLNFAKPRAGKMEQVDLPSIIRDTLKQLQSQIKDAGLHLDTTLDSKIPIMGDREKIHQLTLNLVLNAIDASPSGARLEAIVEEAESNLVRLIIRDEGSGLPAADIEKVFEPFFTTKATGTGLGLAIAKSIVEEHNGQIRFQSEPGQGTAVVIEFPSC